MSDVPAGVGTWILNVVTPIGELVPEAVLNADGTGQAILDFGTIELFDVVCDGDEVRFSMNVQMPMGEFYLTYAGTVAGDDIDGTLEGAVGTFPMAGVRKS